MRVFISHAQNDSELIKGLDELIARVLRESPEPGDKPPELLIESSIDLVPGENWRSKIRNSIENCNVVVALWTPNAAASSLVQYEMAMADALKKRIVVFADPSPMGLPLHLEHYELVSLDQKAHRGTKLNVCVIDDNVQISRLIQEICTLSGLFNVDIYDDANLALRDLELRTLRQDVEPDLFVVDLELKAGAMQGLELIERLATRKIRSPIIAISGLGAEELSSAVCAGAVAAVPKPFSLDDLLEQMKRWANLGRKNRVLGRVAQEMDDSRNERPVFLSYCSQDVRIANLVRRQLEQRDIGVWYAGDMLQPSDKWRERIRHGLTQANVFVPLITNAFVNSSVCKAELSTMLRLINTGNAQPRMIMPILYNYSANATDELVKRCLEYQYVTITDNKFVDGFTALLIRIQQDLQMTRTTANTERC